MDRQNILNWTQVTANIAILGGLALVGCRYTTPNVAPGMPDT